MKKALSVGVYVFLVLLLMVFVFILITPFLNTEENAHLIKPIMAYLDKLPKELSSLTLLSLLATVLISIHNINSQQKQLSLQNEALSETIKDNSFKARQAHIQHFRSNIEEVQNLVIPNIRVYEGGRLNYGSIYSYEKLGKFNPIFEEKLNRCLDHLVALLTTYRFSDKLRNKAQHRFVCIYEQVDELNRLFGLSCTLAIQVEPDDERMFISDLYRYIATSFLGILSVTDGYIGDKYTTFAHLVSDIDFDSYEDCYAICDDEFDENTLSRLAWCVVSSRKTLNS